MNHLVQALEALMANVDDIVERQLQKLLHDPQVRVALEKMSLREGITIEDAARSYMKKLIMSLDDSMKSPSKIKKMVASKQDGST